MIATPTLTTEHHARLMPGVDHLAATAELIGSATGAELRPRLEADCEFLTGLLIEHMEAEEQVLYAQLERLMQNRHSMTPMRREHQRIRVLIGELDERRGLVGTGRLSTGMTVALRRALFQLHALLKIHLAEEQLYADLVERGPSGATEAELAEAMRNQTIGAV